MVFTPSKLAPLNVFNYKLERLINYMRWNHTSEDVLHNLRIEFTQIRNKIEDKIELTEREFSRLELLNKVM